MIFSYQDLVSKRSVQQVHICQRKKVKDSIRTEKKERNQFLEKFSSLIMQKKNTTPKEGEKK
jgi:hypothetical protein